MIQKSTGQHICLFDILCVISTIAEVSWLCGCQLTELLSFVSESEQNSSFIWKKMNETNLLAAFLWKMNETNL